MIDGRCAGSVMFPTTAILTWTAYVADLTGDARRGDPLGPGASLIYTQDRPCSRASVDLRTAA